MVEVVQVHLIRIEFQSSRGPKSMWQKWNAKQFVLAHSPLLNRQQLRRSSQTVGVVVVDEAGPAKKEEDQQNRNKFRAFVTTSSAFLTCTARS